MRRIYQPKTSLKFLNPWISQSKFWKPLSGLSPLPSCPANKIESFRIEGRVVASWRRETNRGRQQFTPEAFQSSRELPGVAGARWKSTESHRCDIVDFPVECKAHCRTTAQTSIGRCYCSRQ